MNEGGQVSVGGKKFRAEVSGLFGCFVHRLIAGYAAMTGNPHENDFGRSIVQGDEQNVYAEESGFEMTEMEARESEIMRKIWGADEECLFNFDKIWQSNVGS